MKAIVFLLGICWLTLAQTAFAACSQPQPRLVCAEYSGSEAVVEATLLKVDNMLENGSDPNSILGRYYTLRSNRVYRGTLGHTIRVYEGNDSSRASFSWKVGTSYLLFLSQLLEKPNEPALAIDGCGNSGPVSRSGPALREIDRLSNQQQGSLIAGNVSNETLSSPLEGIEVVARGNGKAYRASTNKKGNFRIQVPPGDYSLVPEDRLTSFKTYEMSYEDPKELKMQPGACAQVQFLGVVHP
ncbi:MAG: carboxypeptidase-like regulatory domain-containing protein [Terracidiphilus sp.]|jgi:hypothetical protein